MSCLNIAHRGASRDAPENTLQAFELAVVQEADMIETDLHLLCDGEIALYHDDELAGRPVGKQTLAELRAALPSIPTLDQALDAVGARVPFNLEFKHGAGENYAGLVARSLEKVRAHGLLDRTLFSSFYDSYLAELRSLEPAARSGLLISRKSNLAIHERAKRLGAEAVHPELSLVSPELVEDLHGAGYRVHVFTADEEADLRRLLGWGVDGIFTNLPARLRALLGA